MRINVDKMLVILSRIIIAAPVIAAAAKPVVDSFRKRPTL